MDEPDRQQGRMQRLSVQAMRAVQRPVRASMMMVMRYTDAMKRSMAVRIVRYMVIVGVIAAALLVGYFVGLW